jgi:hypothetical protein
MLAVGDHAVGDVCPRWTSPAARTSVAWPLIVLALSSRIPGSGWFLHPFA